MNSENDKKFYEDSLADLEKEYESGELSEADYKSLKAAYSKRASDSGVDVSDSGGDSGDKGADGDKDGDGDKGADKDKDKGADKDKNKDKDKKSNKNKSKAKTPSPASPADPSSTPSSTSPARRKPFYRRTMAVYLGIILILSLIGGVTLALTAGQRSSSEEVTGDIRQNTDSILNQGLLLLNQADRATDRASAIRLYEDSLSFFEGVLDEDPANIEALHGMSRAHFALGDTEMARTILLLSLQLHPQNIGILADLAALELSSGLYGVSQTYLDRIYALNPSATELAQNNVGIMQELIHIDRLIDTYGGNKLFEPDAMPPRSYSELGLPDIETGLRIVSRLTDPNLNYREFNLAGFMLDLLIEEAPENEAVLIQHGRFFINPDLFPEDSEFVERGLASFTKAVELAPEKPELWTERAIAYATLNRIEEAIVDIDMALELSSAEDGEGLGSTYFDHLFVKGQIFFFSNSYVEALEIFTSILEIEPDNIRVLLFRSESFSNLGRYEESLVDINSAIEANDANIAELQQKQQEEGLTQAEEQTLAQFIDSRSRLQNSADNIAAVIQEDVIQEEEPATP